MKDGSYLFPQRFQPSRGAKDGAIAISLMQQAQYDEIVGRRRRARHVARRGGDDVIELSERDVDVRQLLGTKELSISRHAQSEAEQWEWEGWLQGPRLRHNVRFVLEDGGEKADLMVSTTWRSLQTRPWGIPSKTPNDDLQDRLVELFGSGSVARGMGIKKPRRASAVVHGICLADVSACRTCECRTNLRQRFAQMLDTVRAGLGRAVPG
jgi:hypothetical protein